MKNNKKKLETALSKPPKKSQYLCKLSEMEEVSSRGFSVKLKRKKTDIFIVRKDNQVYGYINNCPHAQAPLEWNPDDFLDDKKEMILCAMHGAEFSIEEGACLGGPCNGAGLESLDIQLFGDEIYLI